MSKVRVLTCEHGRWIVDIPIVVEPVVVPVPPAAVPVEVTNVQLAIGIAVKIYKASSVPPPLEFSRG